jgi:hypothetical protein
VEKLARLEKEIWENIRDATARGDSGALRVLAPIADEMDRNYEDWQRRFSRIGEPDSQGQNGVGRPLAQDRRHDSSGPPDDFTGRPIRGFELEGEKVPVGSYKEMWLELAKRLSRNRPEKFVEAAEQVRGRHPYISRDKRDLRMASALGDGLYVETNLNANLIVEICRRLVGAVGYDQSEFRLDVVPFRTRAVKGLRGRSSGSRKRLADREI